MAATATRSPQEAQRKLAVLKRFLVMMGLIYIGLHFWVTFAAYRQAGLVPAIATLVTLGLGDFYWAMEWWNDDGVGPVREASLAATAMAFLSWGTRPFTQQYILDLALQAMRQPEPALRAPASQSNEQAGNGAVADRRPGGAS